MSDVRFYSALEEKLNIYSHALGFVLSLVALPVLIVYASLEGGVWHIVSFSIFGASLSLLYAASTIYHSSTQEARRKRLRIFDHASIYVLIAGTYTPFTLLTLNGSLGWLLFGLSWGFAIIGIILKLFFTGKYDQLSTLMYILMGWMIVFAINPLLEKLASGALNCLFAGGILYTLGAVLYSIKKIPYNHAIFHVFVLLASFCHFVAVFFYLLD